MTARIRAGLAAEWTKLATTPMGATCALLTVALSVGLTAVLAVAMGSANDACAQPGRDCHSAPLRPDVRVATAGLLGDGTLGPGLAVLTVLCALLVTTEHRYGTIATTFMATPRRSAVLAAKLLLAAGAGLALGAVSLLGSTLAFHALGGSARAGFDPGSAAALRMFLTVPVVCVLAAVMAVAVGSLVRHSVVAVAIVLLWPGVAEPLLRALPEVGPLVAPYLPFDNARHLIGLDGTAATWGMAASGLYLLAVTAGLALLAFAHQARTDVRTA